MTELVYLVVGIYEDNYQRFAKNYAAHSAQEAEALALQEHPNLIIAGIINQLCEVVD